MERLKILFRCFVVIPLLLFCASRGTSENGIYSEWYKYYQPISDKEAYAFVNRGLGLATTLYGGPKIPVNHVNLRLSIPVQTNAAQSNFQLCEITDSVKGIFTIYLSRKPTEYAFWGQLGHEIAHLLNAQLYDAYVEGLNTVFAEMLLKKEGKDWSGWLRYFESGQEPFYGATYFMMKEIQTVVGKKDMKRFLGYAVETRGTTQRMHIAINAWLSSLPLQKKKQAVQTIMSHASSVLKTIQGDKSTYRFVLPQP